MPVFISTPGDDFVVKQSTRDYGSSPNEVLKVDGRTGSVTINGQVIDTGLVVDQTARDAAAAAQTTANTAVTNAATAEADAQTGITNAAAAQTTANTAVTNAATAQSTADGAVSVNTAQTASIAAINSTLVAPPAQQLMLMLYDGANLNGSNNTGLVDGSAIGATLKNTPPTVPGGISLASAADLLQATGALQPIFRLTGGPYGTPCVELTGTQFMKSAPFAAQAIPLTIALVWLNTDTLAPYIFYSGADAGDKPQLATNIGGTQYTTYNGANLARVVTIGSTRWNVAITEYNDASSFDLFNGGDFPVGSTGPGTGGMTGFCIGEQGSDGTEKAKGKIALIACWQGRTVNRGEINAWISRKLGVIPA